MTFREEIIFLKLLTWQDTMVLWNADIFETLVMVPLEDRLVSEDENTQRASKLYLW